MARTSRRLRDRSRAARLRPRDVDVLLALARMRSLRTSDIARLFFRNKCTAQKRLRRLFNLGVLRPVVTDLAAESRYRLTPLGHAVLERLSDARDDTSTPAARLSGGSTAHHDLLVGFWVGLAVGARQTGVVLESFRPEWELRSADHDALLVPDALLVVRRSGTPVVLSVECDTGTQRSHVIDNKIDRYDAIDSSGGDLFGVRPDAVLFVTATERRARRLARHLHTRPRGIPVIFGAVPHVLVDGGLTTGLASVRMLVEEPDRGFKSGLLAGIE